MVTKEEWEEWANSRVGKQFIKEIERRRMLRLEELTRFTQQDTIVKDYFKMKGFCEGMMDVVDLLNELKEVRESS